jgi:hypothetical protein
MIKVVVIVVAFCAHSKHKRVCFENVFEYSLKKIKKIYRHAHAVGEHANRQYHTIKDNTIFNIITRNISCNYTIIYYIRMLLFLRLPES